MRSLFKHLLGLGNRISVRLWLGLGGAVSLTMAASLIAWFSFNSVGGAQAYVNEYIPEMAAAFVVARQSSELAAAAPRLTGAGTPADFERVRDEVNRERVLFEQHLAELAPREGEDERVRDIRSRAQTLMTNIREIEDSVAAGFALSEHSGQLRVELVEMQQVLERLLVEAIDDQFFYAVTGFRELDQAPAPADEHFTETEFHRYRHLIDLQLAGTLGTQILASVFNVPDPLQLEPLRERFEATTAMIDRSLDALDESVALPPGLQTTFERLIQLGNGENSTFDVREQELILGLQQQSLLSNNRNLATSLGTDIEGNVSSAQARSLGATREATASIDTGRNLLLWINLLSIFGALLIGWLFVGALAGRIRWLSHKMRTMAAGDLQTEVQMSGHDEVAEMASALEVFRRSSLEAQRLNLVEKLAEELRGKNEELESVLGELQQAQDQIVMREKLAALGELTAGVAHEIKNPLNFVKNFSEGSVEMLGELKEILGTEDPGLSDEKRQQLLEISNDLDENLSSILRNGARADRIVQDMLGMGRGSGEAQTVEVNTLLMEHVRLAWHAARATDPNLQLDIREDLDPNAGKLTVIPHDLGRVFLNMVTNACYTTNEKRRQAEQQQDGAGQEYTPLVTVMSQRNPDNVIIRIRDNGCGIPEGVVEKIFNPFFTTKPADKGTGLGLSLSNDIVVEHGGVIRVDTKVGEYTEMIIELPLESTAILRRDGNRGRETDPPPGAPAVAPQSAPGGLSE